MILMLVARSGARNVGNARADAAKASALDAPAAEPGDVILTPRSPEDALSPDQQALIDKQRAAFNFLAAERSELMREAEALREMATQQRKLDDEYLKKVIALI